MDAARCVRYGILRGRRSLRDARSCVPPLGPSFAFAIPLTTTSLLSLPTTIVRRQQRETKLDHQNVGERLPSPSPLFGHVKGDGLEHRVCSSHLSRRSSPSSHVKENVSTKSKHPGRDALEHPPSGAALFATQILRRCCGFCSSVRETTLQSSIAFTTKCFRGFWANL